MYVSCILVDYGFKQTIHILQAFHQGHGPVAAGPLKPISHILAPSSKNKKLWALGTYKAAPNSEI